MQKKVFYHVIGFVLVAFGIVGIIFSRLGASPIDAFNYFLYTLTPLSLGTVAVLLGLTVSLVCFLIEKKKDMIYSVIFLFIIGILIDSWKFLFEFIPADVLISFYFRIPLAIFSLFVVCFGVAITMTTGLPSLPFERLLYIINKKVKSIKWTKIMIEGTFFIFAVILGTITNQLFEQVHVFTVVLVMFTGPLISMFIDIINKKRIKGEITYAT
ncbi:MAG: hypothetical protein Q7I99_06670 [Acholeplasmataceae bacterium]|nr:hypothetical protein [Acholeplasmataceae bacterium]